MTLTDDDGSAGVTIGDASATEGDTITFTVTLDRAVEGGLTVTPGFTNGTAASTDYTENTAALTFTGTAGETATFKVATTEDTVVESDETFTVSLAVSGTTAPVTATDTGTGTITDDDGSAAVTLTVNPTSVAENAGGTTVTVTATMTGGTRADTTEVTVAVGASGTVRPRAPDYTTVNDFTVTVPGGSTRAQANFTLTPTDDDVVEGDETLSVSGSASGLRTKGATVTITDHEEVDTLPELTISGVYRGGGATHLDEVTAAEGDTLTFTVTLGLAVSGGVTVTPSFTDGTATSATDYTENTAALTFAGTAGEKRTFAVATKDDAVVEADETFTVGLSVSGTTATVTAAGTVKATITDDDGSAMVTVADTSATEGDDITFTVTLDKAVQGGLKVTPELLRGTASSGTDYTQNTDTLTFAGTAGETQTFTVPTTEDALVEQDETFTVSLSVSGTSASVTATDTATGTITNDDTASTGITISVSPTSVTEDADPTSVTVTATLNDAVRASATPVTVKVGATGDGATEGTDYAAVADLTMSIAAGNTADTATFTLTPTDDDVVEGDETLSVTGTTTVTGLTVADTTVRITDDDGSAAVTIGDAAAIEGDTITFTVALDRAVQGGLTLTPSFSGGTATKDTDYTENTAALTFEGTAGETATFKVATTEDTAVESDETFTVGLSASGTTAPVTATDTGTGTIVDDDGSAAVTLTVNPTSVAEGAGATTVTVTATMSGGTRADTTEVTVAVGAAGDGATEGTDYTTVNNFTVTIPGGSTTAQATFTLTPTDDDGVEGDETLSVSGSASGLRTRGTAVTIMDDDGRLSTVPALTVADVSAAEGDSLTFTVRLSLAVSDGLTVTPSFTDGTATSGTDYTENTAALTFTGTAGETKTFRVATTEDAVVEADETFTVGLSVSGTSETVRATDTGTGTITDDDGSAAVAIGDASALEGDTLTFTVTLDRAVDGGLTVTPSFADGTAASTDYTANTTALTFAGTAGETQTFKVATTEDALAEGDETFTVSLSVSGTTAPVTATDTGTGTITNDDTVSTGITLSVDPSEVAEDASATTVTVTVTLNSGARASATPVTVKVGASADAATAGTDYATVDDLTMSIAAGNTADTATFTLTPTNDDVVEGDETLSLSGTTTATGLTVTGTEVTLTDDDGSAAVTVGDASAVEGDTITFTVTLNKAVQGGLTVTPGFTNGTAASTDYTASTAVLTFAGTAGETQSFKVATTEDAVVEGDETFTVSLSVSGTTAPVTDTDTGTGTITDDDGSAAVTLTVNPTSVAENAGATTVTVTATMTGGTRTESTEVTVSVGAAGDGATEGTDYATVNDFTVTIPAGSTRAQSTFTLTPTDDTAIEGDETLSVSGSASGLRTKGTTVTITDDDGNQHRNMPALTINDATAAEGDSLAFTVALNQAVSGGLTVTPSFTDRTATSGTDYTGNTAALSFAGTAGETQTFRVATTEDAVVESDETFTVRLGVSGTTGTVRATDTGTGTITDDDGSAAVTVGDASAAEGDTLTFTVTLDKAVQGGLTVTPSFAGGTATSGTDYTENTAALAFTGDAGETQSFTVATTQDEQDEQDETFTVSLSVSGTTAPVTATDTGTGTITDDDAAPTGITLSVSPSTVAEADTATTVTVTATLNTATRTAATLVTVAVGASGDAAAEGTDYATVADFIVAIPDGETTGEATFTLTPIADTLVEGSETLSVSGTTTVEDLAVTGTSITIADDDYRTPIVTVADASAAEGDSITFTVTLDREVAGGLTVTPSFTDGTATGGGTDYTENTAALAFTGRAGETRSFAVATTEDALVEGDETFTVALTVSGATETVAPVGTGTGTITDDDTASTGVTLSVSPTSAAEDGGAQTVSVTATLDAAPFTGPTEVTVTVGDTADAATAGTDYAAVADFRLTIPAGETTATGTFTLIPTDDGLVEGDEALSVSGAATGLTVTGAAVTIADDDTASTGITLSVSPSSVAEDAAATTVTVTATLDAGAFTGPTEVTVSVGDAGDGATEGTDYAMVPDFTVTIPGGETAGTGTFTLTPTDDALVEGSETLSVAGTMSGSSTITGLSVTRATMTITDDDQASTGVTLSVSPSSVSEDAGATTVTVTATLSGDAMPDATEVTVSVGAPDDAAMEGTDYTAVADVTLTIPAQATSGSATFSLTPTDDNLAEGDEVLSVSGTTTGPTVTGTTMVITDDDDASTSVALSVSRSSVAEDAGATTVIVTATLNAGAKLAATEVTVSVGDSVDNATEGIDYAEVADFTLMVPSGSTNGSATFTLTPADDGLAEGEETLSVSGAATGLAVTGTTLTITDVDAASTGVTLPLAGFGRTVAAGAVDAVTGRFEQTRNGSTATLGGQTLELGRGRWQALRGVTGLLAGRETAEAAFAVVGGGRELLSDGVEFGTLAGHAATLAMEGAMRDELLSGGAHDGRDGGAGGLTRALGGAVGAFGDARASGARPGGLGGLGNGTGGFGSGFGGLGTGGGLGSRSGAIGNPGSDFGVAGGSLEAPGAPGGSSGEFSFASGTSRSAPIGERFLNGGMLGGSRDWRRSGSFNLQLAESDRPNGPGWNLWGRYGRGRYSGSAANGDGSSVDGDVSNAIAGADLRVGSFTMGVAVSRATGEIGIDNRLLGPDLMDASLTTVLPYLRWSPAAGADLWAMGGYGWGEAGLREAAPRGSDLGMRMAALGGRTELARLGAVSLGLRADAFAASLGTEATAELGEVTVGVTQSRLALTLGTGFGSVVRLEPKLDIGARIDGGDAETGAGMEVGGSIGLLGANGSVRLDGSGRWLVAHQVEGFEDWGASVSLAIGSPQAGSQGFGLTLEPEWGGGQRMHDPWASRDGVGLGNIGGRGRAFAAPGAGPTDVAGMWRPDRMRLNLDYGLSLADGAGSLAPFAGVQVDGGAHEMRVGARVRVGGAAAPEPGAESATGPGGIELALLGGRVSRAGSGAGYSAGLDLRGDALGAGALALAPFAEFRTEVGRGAVARLGALWALPSGSKPGSLIPGALALRLFAEKIHLTGEEPAYRLSLSLGASPLSLLPSASAPRR